MNNVTKIKFPKYVTNEHFKKSIYDAWKTKILEEKLTCFTSIEFDSTKIVFNTTNSSIIFNDLSYEIIVNNFYYNLEEKCGFGNELLFHNLKYNNFQKNKMYHRYNISALDEIERDCVEWDIFALQNLTLGFAKYRNELSIDKQKSIIKKEDLVDDVLLITNILKIETEEVTSLKSSIKTKHMKNNYILQGYNIKTKEKFNSHFDDTYKCAYEVPVKIEIIK